MVSASLKLTLEEKILGLNLIRGERKELETILNSPVNHIADRRFRRPAQMQEIMDKQVQTVQGLKLETEDEKVLFLQMNYAQFRVGVLKRKLLRQKQLDPATVRETRAWHQKYLNYRTQIVASNMGLVLAISKRSNFSGMEMTDLISEGSVALLRAVEKFDCGRGYKFSTYAWRVIIKAFARMARKQMRYHNVFPAQLDPELEKDNHLESERLEIHQDLVQEVRSIITNNLANLSGIEKTVVELRFNLTQANPTPMTLLRVGEHLGLSKERIRQIQNHALAKLRVAAEERMMAV